MEDVFQNHAEAIAAIDMCVVPTLTTIAILLKKTNATQFAAKRGKVIVNGSGERTVNVSDELDAKVIGSGTIWYMGSPKLTSAVSGSGSIKQKSI